MSNPSNNSGHPGASGSSSPHSHQSQQQQQQPMNFFNHNSNNNNSINPNNPDNANAGAPLFTVEQLRAMQMASRNNSAMGGAAAAAAGQQQQHPSSLQQQQQDGSGSNGPYMVLTQLPIQAIPFGNFAGQPRDQQQQQQPFPNNNSNNNNHANLFGQQQVHQHWAQLLQPTPLHPDYNQNQQHYHQPSYQQQQAQQQQQQRQQQQQQGRQQQQGNSDTNVMLQQLMRNAYAAQQQGGSSDGMSGGMQASSQQQLQQQQHQQNLYTLGSTVEPVQRNNSNDDIVMGGASFGDSILSWKQFWDESNDPDHADDKATVLVKRKFTPEPGAAEGEQATAVAACAVGGPSTTLRTTTGFSSGSGMLDPMPLQIQKQLQDKQQGPSARPPMPLPPMPATMGSIQFQQLVQQQQQQQQLEQHQAAVATNQGLNEGDDEDDVAPTPLSEIRAKQFQRMQQVDRHMHGGTPTSPSMSSHHSTAPSPMSISQPAPAFSSNISMDGMSASSPIPASMNQHLNMPLHLQQQQQQQQQFQLQFQQQQQQQLLQSKPESEKVSTTATAKRPSKHGSSILPAPSNAFLLPSTMMPPSVLASVCTSQPRAKAVSAAGRYKKKTGNKSVRTESPQDALARILQMRGYGTNIRIKAEQASYDTMPSALQLASFGTELVKAIHTSDVESLSELLSTGLSPNPCNQFRDSIVDLVCKRANVTIFQCLVDHGCDLRVCDGFGRTPLHHCCWASDFSRETAEIILDRDWMQLLIEDKRGQTPLEYVRPDQAAEWVDFLEDVKDKYFQVGGSIPHMPNLKELRPEGSLPDPPNALPVPLAAAVSSGQISPKEVREMDAETRASYQT